MYALKCVMCALTGCVCIDHYDMACTVWGYVSPGKEQFGECIQSCGQ